MVDEEKPLSLAQKEIVFDFFSDISKESPDSSGEYMKKLIQSDYQISMCHFILKDWNDPAFFSERGKMLSTLELNRFQNDPEGLRTHIQNQEIQHNAKLNSLKAFLNLWDDPQIQENVLKHMDIPLDNQKQIDRYKKIFASGKRLVEISEQRDTEEHLEQISKLVQETWKPSREDLVRIALERGRDPLSIIRYLNET